MRINTNAASLVAQENANNNNKTLSSSLEKLSSGLAINKASDDASGLAIADKLRTQASSIKQSMANGNSAIALTQIADKAMAEQSNILDIVKTKLLSASTATTSTEGRQAISKDINKLLGQIDNIASQTNYNGLELLQGSETSKSASAALTFQMGELSANDIKSNGSVQANVTGLSLSTLNGLTSSGATSSLSTTMSAGSADAQLTIIDAAITQLNNWRADFGSTQNQLESAMRNMATQYTNIKTAESVVRDVDYASESANFNKSNIIAQAGTYAMSQANAMAQNVQKLLQ